MLDAILAGDEPRHLTWVNVFEYQRILTRDAAFQRIPDVEVVDPPAS